jgi:hypothetical protein
MYEFCLLGCGIQVPAGPDWYHEIKYDGFRLLCSERRHGLQASGSTLSRRPAEALDQGEEPEAPRLRARQRIFLMTSCMLSLTALGLIHSEAAEPSAKRVAGGDGCSSGVSKPIRTASFLVIL